MAFREVTDLSTDVTISLGGSNKKTGKVNPTKIEGYYLGKREVQDAKKKSGVSYIYTIQTSKGNVGVWGKTDLDRKMQSAPAGAMIRITQNGMTPTANGDMYKFKVEVDADNTIDVGPQPLAVVQSGAAEEEESNPGFGNENEDVGLFEDEAPADEIVPQRPVARAVAKTPTATQQSRVQALLASNRTKLTG